MSNVLTFSPVRANFARAISDIFSPPVAAVPALAVGAWASETRGTYWYALLYFCIAVLLPIVYVVWAIRTGRITDFHMSNRRERVAPFLVSLVCGLAAWILLIELGAPRDFVGTRSRAARADAAIVFDHLGVAGQRPYGSYGQPGDVYLPGRGTAAMLLIGLIPLVAWARFTWAAIPWPKRSSAPASAALVLRSCSPCVASRGRGGRVEKWDWLRPANRKTREWGNREVPVPVFQRAGRRTTAAALLRWLVDQPPRNDVEDSLGNRLLRSHEAADHLAVGSDHLHGIVGRIHGLRAVQHHQVAMLRSSLAERSQAVILGFQGKADEPLPLLSLPASPRRRRSRSDVAGGVRRSWRSCSSPREPADNRTGRQRRSAHRTGQRVSGSRRASLRSKRPE